MVSRNESRFALLSARKSLFLEDAVFRLKACCVLTVALSIATASFAAEGAVPVKHPHHARRVSSDVIIVHTPHPAPPYFPVGFVSYGSNFGEGGANGLSGDDSYGPPYGFHGGLSRDGVILPGPGGPFDRVNGCEPGFSC
jgi:hypothetical protein